MTNEGKQEALMQEFEKYPELTADILYLYENGKGFNLIWWSKFLANINAALTKAALTEAPKVDIEALKKECREIVCGYEGCRGCEKTEVSDDIIDYLATHYDLVKKEK